MKKILYILTIISALFFASCSDELETSPTDKIAGNVMLNNPDGGQAVLNGMYRALYTYGWGSGWESENSGLMAFMHAADLMGEDMVQQTAGSGWFWYDYRLNIASDYTHNAGRPYQAWNMFYILIANANMVLSKENEWILDKEANAVDSKSKAVIGQAFAMRAFAYSNLIQLYQQSISEGEDLAGVPIYEEPTTIETQGRPRGTIADVYALMNSDIDKATSYLEEAEKEGWKRDHESNIDSYVANGIKARIALNEGADYSRAHDAAVKAMSKSGLNVLQTADFIGWNNRNSANVMWALEVVATQSEGVVGFFAHMDADAAGSYGSRARILIATGLYNLIPDTDTRKQLWWRGVLKEEEEKVGTSMTSHCQLKFKFGNAVTRIGDYLLMRKEEMLLIAAESAARMRKFTDARAYLQELGDMRDPNYAERLKALKDGDGVTYSTNTLAAPTTILEEALFQRRVELWGEYPRGFDLKRLGLGYNRTYTGSNHSAKLSASRADKRFTMPIPQAEFDGNSSMKAEDQNPM